MDKITNNQVIAGYFISFFSTKSDINNKITNKTRGKNVNTNP